MPIVIITGSAGLIGSQTATFFHEKGFDVIGVDNNLRKTFFGEDACTLWNRYRLERNLSRYRHITADIRDTDAINTLFSEHGKNIACVVHCAAQPSHDWAANDPFTDFTVNANGTLALLEATRKYCPEAAFIFTSTNKVYGDTPNRLPLVELESRWELHPDHRWHARGIDETMSIDTSKHSLFGVSKVAADVLVQEYGHYFGMNTVCFRGGCLTGPAHSGAQLHGFLNYLMRCCVSGKPYFVFGYKGKQVRDNIHAFDLVNMFWHYVQDPRPGTVYNAGGGRHSNCSMLEAIEMCEKISGKKLQWEYREDNRIGDHIWWISDVSKFQEDYPDWHYTYSIMDILEGIYEALSSNDTARKSA
ncbi:NAD-dependent epimerase/dehydratase family protein [Desulfosarcina ovata]|uniref:NAD-dependent epimerase n=1 Tax=Desulfosarcina ovata subsp. ovata TaxID=2752305 RepID=A0A5K8A8D5_9BACT|nr:NAD-dependent epimerase/dehydratase family protein [Desulfosarcina ovata]BBO88320.1 NAD-dependent epimerase [Desulfosarcina ovata subsp. ovata]